jgi:hypothetical protein
MKCKRRRRKQQWYNLRYNPEFWLETQKRNTETCQDRWYQGRHFYKDIQNTKRVIIARPWRTHWTPPPPLSETITLYRALLLCTGITITTKSHFVSLYKPLRVLYSHLLQHTKTLHLRINTDYFRRDGIWVALSVQQLGNGLDGPGLESRQRQEISLFSKTSRLAPRHPAPYSMGTDVLSQG